MSRNKYDLDESIAGNWELLGFFSLPQNEGRDLLEEIVVSRQHPFLTTMVTSLPPPIPINFLRQPTTLYLYGKVDIIVYFCFFSPSRKRCRLLHGNPIRRHSEDKSYH